MNSKLLSLFSHSKPLIGMIHLPPLPGYPNHPGMDEVFQKALFDLKTLEKAGFDGALVENDNDQPHQIHVNEEIKTAFSRLMKELLKQAAIPIGMEIIYDMEASVTVAQDVNASFIRLDVFADSVKTQWGEISAQAASLMNLQKELNSTIPIMADVQVKHATLLEKKPLMQSAKQSVELGALGLIVTGNWTGEAPTIGDCKTIKKAAPTTPLFIGSGFCEENAATYLPLIDGVIVGTSIKKGDLIDFEKSSRLATMVHTNL